MSATDTAAPRPVLSARDVRQLLDEARFVQQSKYPSCPSTRLTRLGELADAARMLRDHAALWLARNLAAGRSPLPGSVARFAAWDDAAAAFGDRIAAVARSSS